MRICDIHTHVLPGVDDGAQTMEYALQMLQNAAAGDVEMLALTPHCNVPFWPGNELDRPLLENFERLCQAAEQIPVQLVLGAEVRVNENLLDLLAQKKAPTLNGSRYLLTEFARNAMAEDFSLALQQILQWGYVPLVAHPERYGAVQQAPHIVGDWLDMGCHLQLTGGSILGEYSKPAQQTAAWLLQNDLVACVASDAHGLHRRSNFLLDVYDHLTVHYCKQYAACLLYENPMAMCHDEKIGEV